MAGVIKRKVIRPIRDYLFYLLLQFAIITFRMQPRSVILYIHGQLSILFFHISAGVKRNVLHQLSLVFGKDKSGEEIHRMGRDVFINLAKTFTDYIFFTNLTTREEFSNYFSIEGEEHLQKAYNKGKGVLCLIPHTCGWEFSAIMPPVLGYETSAISREIKMPALNKTMVRLREKRKMKNICRNGKTYDKLKEVLNRGECLIIMIDQDSKRVRGEFLKFFNMDAYTPLGCARLAIETGAAIVPMATFRKPDDTYLFKILPEVELKLTGNLDYDLKYNTQLHNHIIEEFIREHPEQWVWMHKRWSTTPQVLNDYWKGRLQNA